MFGDLLKMDDLQFGYQAGCNTTMATWVALENIQYFLRNGSEVFVCLMDMTKAFDMVQHSILFKKLLKCGLPPIFARLILFMYIYQKANVRWGGKLSDFFNMAHGVKQGAVLSAILYCFYTNELFQLLRAQKVGCWIQGKFSGAVGYADDNLIMAPTHSALQHMLKTCEKFAIEHNLQFSTHEDPKKSKTKCLAFLKNKRNLDPIKLNDKNLPWIEFPETVLHLGTTIDNGNLGMSADILKKRATFIQRNNELLQEFSFADPETKVHLNNIYNMSFSGSPLWDLFSDETDKILKTYNKSLRIMWDIPMESHRYLLEPLSDQTHLKFLLFKRFLNFRQQIFKSDKTITKHIYSICENDCGSLTGRNLRRIMLLCDKNSPSSLEASDISSLQYFSLPQEEEWRIGMINELIDIRLNRVELPGFSKEEINDLLKIACVS